MKANQPASDRAIGLQSGTLYRALHVWLGNAPSRSVARSISAMVPSTRMPTSSAHNAFFTMGGV